MKGLPLASKIFSLLRFGNFTESEKIKLLEISEILERYHRRDLLISGHTALAGTREERLSLSLERANAVNEYLIKNKGSRTSSNFYPKALVLNDRCSRTTPKNRKKIAVLKLPS